MYACRHSLEDLQLVAECIGGPGLAQVCRLLAQDHGGWSGAGRAVGAVLAGLKLRRLGSRRPSSQVSFVQCSTGCTSPCKASLQGDPRFKVSSCCALAVLSAGGMPDLLLWHTGRRAAKLAEVKGPRDRLSDQQRAWMAALSGGWRLGWRCMRGVVFWVAALGCSMRLAASCLQHEPRCWGMVPARRLCRSSALRLLRNHSIQPLHFAEAGLQAEVLKVVEREASGSKGGGGKKRKKR